MDAGLLAALCICLNLSVQMAMQRENTMFGAK